MMRQRLKRLTDAPSSLTETVDPSAAWSKRVFLFKRFFKWRWFVWFVSWGWFVWVGFGLFVGGVSSCLSLKAFEAVSWTS